MLYLFVILLVCLSPIVIVGFLILSFLGRMQKEQFKGTLDEVAKDLGLKFSDNPVDNLIRPKKYS